jgi:hypothetical protein
LSKKIGKYLFKAARFGKKTTAPLQQADVRNFISKFEESSQALNRVSNIDCVAHHLAMLSQIVMNNSTTFLSH